MKLFQASATTSGSCASRSMLMCALLCTFILAPALALSSVSFFDGPKAVISEALRSSAAAGDATAEFELGFTIAACAEEEMAAGWHGKARALYKDAAGWFEKAANQGHAKAQFFLGYLTLNGLGISRDAAAAKAHLSAAARHSIPDALFLLGMMHASGNGAPKNIPLALTMLSSAGHTFAKTNRPALALEAARSISSLRPGYPAVQTIVQEVEKRGEIPIPEGTRSTGTGWPVAEGFVVTNMHVVRGRTQISLLLTDGTRLKAQITAADANNDLVLLSVDDPCALPPALPLMDDAPGLGADVFTLGFPQVAVLGSSPKLSVGRIIGMRGMQDDPRTYTISVPIAPGNSGGPLVTLSGEVAGVVQSSINTARLKEHNRTLPGSMNYALRAGLVRQLIARAPGAKKALASRALDFFGLSCPKTLRAAKASLEEHASTIQHSVVMVIAE